MKTRNSLAFLLHARDYSETSVIASFLTKDFGILNALLKGAKRKGSKFANILSPGSELYISYSDKNALKTIFECEINKQIPIAPKNLKILIYLNELILKIFEKEHDIPVVFKDYDELMSLMTLVNKDEILELSLRNFEYRLITDLGYGFDLTKNDIGSLIEPDQDYLFSPLRGIYSLDKGDIETSFKGQHLLDFMSGKFSNNMTKKVIKSIFRESLEAILGKELNARKYFN